MVIECAGGRDTFQAAWRLARPNGTVALVAMYEENQTLPLPAMYGKNLVFKTGGVDASRGPELVSLLAQGKLRTDFLITHRGPLSEILRATGCLGPTRSTASSGWSRRDNARRAQQRGGPEHSGPPLSVLRTAPP